jgi:hypothetical protein
MNLAAVQSAGLLGEGIVVAVTVAQVRFIPWYALLVVRKLQYHLSPGKGDRFTVKSAMPR